MNENYYVYVYFDPRKSPPEPIYVGKGYGYRYKAHLTQTHNSLFERKLNKIKNENLEPIIEFAIKDITPDVAAEKEVELIKKYGKIIDKTGTLCNYTNGGDGTWGYKHSSETLKLFSEQRKGKKQTEAQYKANCSRKHSEEAKEKISKANKGQFRLTPEQAQKLREFNLGKKASEETKALLSKQRKGKKQTEAQYWANCHSPSRERFKKKVKCLNNNVVYESIAAAARDLGLHHQCIVNVANGKFSQHKSYKFVFV